jgi:hypothetical protein
MGHLLRALLRLHLRRSRTLWTFVALFTAFMAWGALRVERRMDLMSLLPTEHPMVRASLEAGVGQQELLWLAAEGTEADLPAREAWAEGLVERLLDRSGMPLNGLGGEGRLSAPRPVPGPEGVSVWPPLLAAGSLVDGDPPVMRLLTGQFYALAPALLGDRLAPLAQPAELRRHLDATVQALRSPDPVAARLAQLDPLGLRTLIAPGDVTFARSTQAGRAFPLKLCTGYMETRDGRFVLLPLVVDFPSGRSVLTGRLLTWLGTGGTGALPARGGLGEVEKALGPQDGRSFSLQVTGAHAVAYFESVRLAHEVALSLVLSFILIGAVYWAGFRTLTGYGFVVTPLLVGMVWALGLVGWTLGHLNLVSAGFGAVLLGVGDDVGILLFSRYRESRQAGRDKAEALRAALMGTGPGVVAGALATILAFLACMVAPFPGLRELGLTAGLGLLACLVASFLILPALLLAFDRGQGTFAHLPGGSPAGRKIAPWKPWATVTVLGLAVIGALRVTWEEDLRRFRQAGNPALVLQQALGKVLGAGLQPLALQVPLDDPDRLPHRWNRATAPLRREGLPLPEWRDMAPELRKVLGSETWLHQALDLATRVGLDATELERPLAALRASVEDPGRAAGSMQSISASPPGPSLPGREGWNLAKAFRRKHAEPSDPPMLTIPIRLEEAAQERAMDAVEAEGGRLIGTRPLFRALKGVARESLRDALLVALAAVLLTVGAFGRRFRFVLFALLPLAAGMLGALGLLGLTGEPLTFLSIVALPIALGVSVDTAMNLLHRARSETDAAQRVARVNAVCAGTTLAGFGGLVFSGYRGLRGLGLACLGGVALALLVTQWLLPVLLEKWPLRKGER